MTEIGGYFGLELYKCSNNPIYKDRYALNSGRNSLEYILLSLNFTPNVIYIPYFTCEVVLEPIKKLGIKYKFYHINDRLEVEEIPDLGKMDLIIVNNYFGIKDQYIDSLIDRYGDLIIVDNAQAFFHNTKKRCRVIYSPRKFFGVPDGGFAVSPDICELVLTQSFSTDRAIHLLRRLDAGAEIGYKEFQNNDKSLSNEPIKSMSRLTRHILNSIDYQYVRNQRRGNFFTLHNVLQEKNHLQIPGLDTFDCPMVYPFMTDDPYLRKQLISEKVFVATYWPNVFQWCKPDSIEYNFASNILPLPIDQRYGIIEMDKICKLIKKYS